MAMYHFNDLINFLNSSMGQEKLAHVTYTHLNMPIKELKRRKKKVASTFIGNAGDMVSLIYQLLEKDQEAIAEWMDKPYNEVDGSYYCLGWSDEDRLDNNNLKGKAVIKNGKNYIECDCYDAVVVLEKDRESDKIFFKTAYPYPEELLPWES